MSLYETRFVGLATNDLGNVMQNKTTASINFPSNTLNITKKQIVYPQPCIIKESDIVPIMNGSPLYGDQTYTFGPMIQNRTIVVNNTITSNTLSFSNDDYNYYGLRTTFSGNGKLTNALFNGSMWVCITSDVSNNNIGYSYDGITWTINSNTSAIGFLSICWFNNMWLIGAHTTAGGTAASIFYSYDGINWTGIPNTASQIARVYSIQTNGHILLAVGTNSGITAPSMVISYDGLTWTTATTNLTARITTKLFKAIWNGSIWLAVGEGTNGLAYTTDPFGLTGWIGLGNTAVSSVVNDCVWNGTIFVAVGTNSQSKTICYSYNGINWHGTPNIFGTNPVISVSWNGNKFIAAACLNGSTAIGYSYNGMNWRAITNPLFTGSVNGICAKSNSLRPHSITFQRNMVVAGCSGIGNTIAYSLDGFTWTGITQPVFSTGITTAVYNGRIWVAGAANSAGSSGNTIGTSTNGMNWKGLGTSLFSQECNSIIWNSTSSIWIAGGIGINNLGYSYDGLTWIPVVSPLNTCYGITSYNNKFVSVGYGGNTIANSTDGINWTGVGNQVLTNMGLSVATNGTIWVSGGQSASSIGSIVYSYDTVYWTDTNTTIFSLVVNVVAWNGQIWVAVGTGTNSTAYSYDGINWNAGTNIFPDGGYHLVWNGSVWISTSPNGMAYSYDGINWSTQSNSAFLYVYGLGSNYGIQPKPFIQHPTLAFGSGTNTIAYSVDGINWTGLGSAIFSTAGRKAFWNGKMWVAGGSGTNSLAFSYDGLSWVGLGSSIFTGANGCFSICYNGSIWVAVGQGTTTIAYSTDGTTWRSVAGSAAIFTSYGTSIAWNGSVFLANGIGGNSMATSQNGITWTGVPSVTSYASVGTNYSATNGSLWVASVGSNVGLIYTNDITGRTGWTAVNPSPFTTSCTNVLWNGQIWVAGGSGTTGNLAYSTNGITWTNTSFPSAVSDICWTGSRFVAIGTGRIGYSTDGITWFSNPSVFSTLGLGVVSNSSIGAFVAPSALSLNNYGILGNGISFSQTLDIISPDQYSQPGYDSVSISVAPTFAPMYSSNWNFKTNVANNSAISIPPTTYIATGNVSSTIVNGNTIVSFLSGTGTIQFSNNIQVNTLVVGGGAGGGYQIPFAYGGGGGGGGGSVGYGSLNVFPTGTYLINVGEGGILGNTDGNTDNLGTAATNGGNSSISGIGICEVAYGGGGGGAGALGGLESLGLAGGSGGGGSGAGMTWSGGAAVYGYGSLTYLGNPGGRGVWYAIGQNGGGGGGAIVAGQDGTNVSGTGIGGNGYTWTPNSTTYGGGGGGGALQTSNCLGGIGGTGGGGDGGNYISSIAGNGLPGTPNTGGGGGGGSSHGGNGANGGSGIVSFAFQFSSTVLLPSTTGLGFYLTFNSLTVPTVDSYNNALTINGNLFMIPDVVRGNVLFTTSGNSSISTIYATPSSFSRTFWYRPIILGAYSNTVSSLNLPIAYNGSNYISAEFNYTGSSTVVTDETNIKGLNSWIHYALTYNTDTSTATLYANGTQVKKDNTITFTGDAGTINNGGLCIGDYNNSSRGSIAYYDKIRAYNRELTSIEIATIYNHEFITSRIPISGLNFYLIFGNQRVPTIDAYGNSLTANGNVRMLSTFRGIVADMSGSSFSTTLPTNRKFTRCFWYNPIVINGPMNTLSSKNLKMHFNGTNFMTATFNVTGTPVSIADTVNRGINTWTHYALTYTGTTATLYVNGVQVATNSSIIYTGEPGTLNNGGLCIGDYNNTGAGVTGGNASFDIIQSYNVALTAAEIATIYTFQTILDGLIFYLPLNTASVPTTDLCGNALTNNGSVSISYDYIAGYVGSMSTVSTSFSTAISTPSSFTRTFWYNPNSITGQMNTLSSKNLKMHFNGTSYMTATFNVTGTPLSISDTTIRSAKAWTHYALTYTGTTATLYVNGAQVATNTSITYIGETGALNNGGLCIGDYNNTGVGAIANFENVRCFNRALTAFEIVNMYTQEYIGPPVPTTGLTFNLNFGSVSVPTADSLGNALTNNNSVTTSNEITRGYVAHMSAVNKSFSTTYATPASFTRAFWYNPIDISGAMNTLTSKNLRMYYNSTNFMTVLFNVVSGTQATLVDRTARGTDWTHYVLTYNASTTTAILYVNGGQVAINTSVIYTGETGTLNNGGLCIGDYNNTGVGSRAYFDKIRCYNRAITVSEVFSIYTSEYIPNLTSLTSNATISTTSGGYNLLIFQSSGTINIVSYPTTTFYYLCVGGGGGGGGGGGYNIGAGGGGGGLLQGSFVFTGDDTITISVGAGGAWGTLANDNSNIRGGNSSIIFTTNTTNNKTSIGGGLGGGGLGPGQSGGSGGGAGYTQTTGGAGTSGQGNAGGDSLVTFSYHGYGGGGGAGTAGGGGNGDCVGGNGVICTQPGISNYYSTTYFSPGGGGTYWRRQGTRYRYPGGLGMGSPGSGGYGATNQGSGNAQGANGLSGIVVISYIPASGGSRVLIFNNGIGTFNLGFSTNTVPTVDLCGNFIVANGAISIANDSLRGRVLYTSGINQSISANYATTTAFTRAFWYNPTTISGQMNTVSSKNLKMFFNGTNFMTALFNVVSGTQVSIADTTNRGTASWNHYALTYSGTTAILYVNGVSVASNTSVTYTGENGTINNGGLCIGDYNGTGVGGVAYFDKIRSYNTALSSAQITALYNAEYIATSKLISNGTLTGWTTNGAITSSSSFGNPAPAIYSTGGSGSQYAYVNLANYVTGLTNIKGGVLQFDIYTGNNSCIDLFFGCNSSGSGQMWRLWTNGGTFSGISVTATWTNWSPGFVPPSPSPLLSGNTWYTIIITISSAGVATYTYNGIAAGQSYTIANNNGTYIGVQGDSLSGGYVDNVYFTA
jgi:hypothetical protein